MGEVVPRVTAPSETVAAVEPAKPAPGTPDFTGTIYFTSGAVSVAVQSVINWILVITVAVALVLG